MGTPVAAKAGPMSPEEITDQVVASLAGTHDPRLGYLMQTLVRCLHSFVVETSLTTEERLAAVKFLTATGQACTATRQEFILLSDTLGISMVLDAVNHPAGGSVTESTVLGPFYVPESPERQMGDSISEMEGNGEPALVSGTVRNERGDAIAIASASAAEADLRENRRRSTPRVFPGT